MKNLIPLPQNILRMEGVLNKSTDCQHCEFFYPVLEWPVGH